MNDSMAACVLSYSLELLSGEGYPIPKSFTKKDVNYNAPPLFTDTFTLFYLYTMTLHGLNGYSLSVGNSVRRDQRDYFIHCMQETTELYDRIVDLMLEKGIFSRSPLIPPPHEVDFVKEQGYLTGWFGRRRPLNAIEITNIYFNMQKSQAKAALEIGFSQARKARIHRNVS